MEVSVAFTLTSPPIGNVAKGNTCPKSTLNTIGIFLSCFLVDTIL